LHHASVFAVVPFPLDKHNYTLFAPEYEPYKLKNELGKDFQDCFLPNIPIELILNRYSGSLHKSLKLNNYEFLSRQVPLALDKHISSH